MDASAVLAITAVWNVLIPYLREAGNAASKKSGEAVIDWFRKMVSTQPDESKALSRVESNPSDVDAVNDLSSRLGALIRKDADSQNALKDLLHGLGVPIQEHVHISQTAGDNAKQFGQVYGNITFGDK